MGDYKWTSIEPLSDLDRAIDLGAIRSVYETWKASKDHLLRASPNGLREFNQRLIRRLSIETGILERLYDLDRGTTEALVAHGFREDLVTRSSTDIEPSHLVDILRDQESAIQLVMDCVGGRRQLTKGFIHELHAILTRHEDSTTAIDQFGRRFEIPLLKGKFKEHPNNPRRPDGGIHEYCPPMHVEAEIQNLLHWLVEAESENPLLAASWLHHRFTQIHPYQDGNGRVARALTTLVLLKADLLPLVIDRDIRTEYITALEFADASNLEPLTSLFARLEHAAIMQALSVDADAEISHQQTLTSAAIANLAQKLTRRRAGLHIEFRQVNVIAKILRNLGKIAVEKAFNQLSDTLGNIVASNIRFTDGGPEFGNSHWYKYEVIRSANESSKFANFSEDHYFVKSSVQIDAERLTFVVSLHHVGRELSGIMEATAFALFESYEETDERASAQREFVLCSTEPFVFSNRTTEQEVSQSFGRWMDAATAIALGEFGHRI